MQASSRGLRHRASIKGEKIFDRAVSALFCLENPYVATNGDTARRKRAPRRDTALSSRMFS